MSSAPLLVDPGADLAAWAAAGDRQALDRVLAVAADAAYEQAYRLLGRAADADDATQEALVQLARSAHRYDASRPFRPWLARLVHDACCRVLRAGRRRRRHETAARKAAEPMTETIDIDAVRAAVLDLPESYRAAVELHYFAGLSQAEAAQALGIGEGACAMRLSRARDRLRPLLKRYGVGAATAVALVAVTSGPVHAASAGAAAQVSALAAAGKLPATTIPVGILRNGLWMMRGHPVAGGIAAAALVMAMAAPFLMVGEESLLLRRDAKSVSERSAQARALLQYVEPPEPFRLDIDVMALRQDWPSTRISRICDDPQAAQAWDAVRAEWKSTTGSWGSTDLSHEPLRLMLMSISNDACSFALRRLGDGKTLAFRALDAKAAGRGTSLIRTHGFHSIGVGKSAMAGQKAEEADTDISISVLARDVLRSFQYSYLDTGAVYPDRTMEHDAPQWLRDRAMAKPAPEPPAPIWFQLNATALIASYARLAGTDGDPAGVGNVLGSRWKSMKPVVEGSVNLIGEDIVGSVSVSGAAPMSPMVPLTMCLGGAAEHPLGMMTAWPMRPPHIGIAPSADRIASLTMGLDPQVGPSPFAQRLTSVSAKIDRLRAAGETSMLVDYLLLDVLEAWWSGDLALEVRPGAPLPRVALVMGLRSDAEPAAVLRLIKTYLGIPLTTGDAAPFVIGGMPLGQYTLSAGSDRIVLTWNAEPADWPGIVTAPAPANAPGCSVWVDSPTLVRQWGGFALLGLTPEQRRLIPPLPVLAKHLPVWSVEWHETADGCRIDERGLPIVVSGCALAALAAAAACDPEAETRQGRELQQRMQSPPPPPRETTPQPGVF